MKIKFTNSELPFEATQKVEVELKSGKNYKGTIIDVLEKSLKVATVDGDKIVMFITDPKITLLDDNKNPIVDEKTSTASNETPKEEPKVEILPYFIFVKRLMDDQLVTFPEKELIIAQTIVLTKKGNIALEKLMDDYADGNYKDKTQLLVSELSRIGKSYAKKSKAKTEEAPKEESKTETPKETIPRTVNTSVSINPIIEAITKVVDEKSFKSLLAEVVKNKIEFIGVKNKKTEYTLIEFKNGNIYVKNMENEKEYFSSPIRFSKHFAIKE